MGRLAQATPDWWGSPDDLPRWREWLNAHFDWFAWVFIGFTVLLIALLAYGWGYAAGERAERKRQSAEVVE